MSPDSNITWLLLTSPVSPKPPLPSPRSAGLSQLLSSCFSSTTGLLPPTRFLRQAFPAAPELREPPWLSTPGQVCVSLCTAEVIVHLALLFPAGPRTSGTGSSGDHRVLSVPRTTLTPKMGASIFHVIFPHASLGEGKVCHRQHVYPWSRQGAAQPGSYSRKKKKKKNRGKKAPSLMGKEERHRVQHRRRAVMAGALISCPAAGAKASLRSAHGALLWTCCGRTPASSTQLPQREPRACAGLISVPTIKWASRLHPGCGAGAMTQHSVTARHTQLLALISCPDGKESALCNSSFM